VTADLLVVGRIATLAGGTGFGWVEALAIEAGRVVAAGRLSDVESVAGPATRRLLLAPSEVAIPGLTDAHVHLLEAALAAERVDLSRARTLADGLAFVARAHAMLPDPDSWIEGGGWDPNVWSGWPTADDLEAVAPGRRVALWAHDHHALLASHRALADAGIDARTGDTPGGVIRRDESGRPTGVLHEHASRLVTAIVPAPDGHRVDRAVERWCGQALGLGLVAVHDLGPLAPDPGLGGAFAATGRLDAARRLPIRAHAGIREESLDEAIRRGLRTGDPIAADGRGRARVGWWKRFADGSLGSRTAFLREPYERTSDRGLLLLDPAELRAGVARAAAGGIATAVHAIGDGAVDAAIDALAPAAPAGLAGQPRIEHAQLVHDDQLGRLASARIALSMQPFHAVSDAPSIAPAWGARARHLGYRWRSIVGAEVRLAFGTDAPVEDVDPWPGLAAAIDRTAATIGESASVLDPAEALPLDSALRGVCVAPALVAGEHDRGRLEAGHRSDLVVVPLPTGARFDDPSVVRSLRPRLVLVDGEVAFER
jgi:predicted amidohydrolase YtcJ